jgi:hypothetical protein
MTASAPKTSFISIVGIRHLQLEGRLRPGKPAVEQTCKVTARRLLPSGGGRPAAPRWHDDRGHSRAIGHF